MITQSKPASPAFKKNRPAIINAWCSYDWANSVYNLTVTSTIFPVYYSAVTREAFGGEEVNFMGWAIKNTVLYSYAISLSFLIIVLLSPLLSGIADYSGRKKRFMQFFTYLGAASCMGLYFFRGANIELGILLSIMASIGYAGSLVFYNAFLPEISTPDRMDKISARGFSLGYIGSVILLLLNLFMISEYETFGFADKSQSSRFAFLLVGIWWFGFSQVAFYFLKDNPSGKKVSTSIMLKGLEEIRKVFTEIRKMVSMPRFLLSFFFYSMGVQTIILLAPLFGESVIGLSGEKLIMTVLLLQMVAIAGSYFFAFVAKKWGNKLSILSMLLIWTGICVGAFMLQNEQQFFIMAAFVGLVLGGIQAISRSTYSKLVPQDATDTASYFSFYELTEKSAIVLGTLSYGFIEQISGNMRNSSLAMGGFFIAGLLVLLATPLAKEKRKRKN